MSTSRHAVLALALAAAALALPAAAQAGQGGVAVGTFTYDATAGETNDVTITHAGSTVKLVDTANVAAGPGCSKVTDHELSCDGVFGSAVVRLGDDPDRAATSFGISPQGPVELQGGTGDDRLSDGVINGNRVTFSGGDGDDYVQAADVADEDSVTDEREMAPTADPISCGTGKDRIDIDVQDATSSDCEIVALLEETGSNILGTDGADELGGFSGDGDEDRILGLGGNDLIRGRAGDDKLYGKAGDDDIKGDGTNGTYPDGNDLLSGGTGADLLNGGGGNDLLSGGKGKDKLYGGKGSDRFSARDGSKDRIKCGAGFDRVTADQVDSVSSDCEVVSKK
ncbi:MAG TPA: calcium-binding protein [Thermoleophilaceae bacterium]